jgi:hypothetical protein
MPELALDYVKRDALAGHLDRVRLGELGRCEFVDEPAKKIATT